MKQSKYRLNRTVSFFSLPYHLLVCFQLIALSVISFVDTVDAATNNVQSNTYPFTITTEIGQIEIELHENYAPNTVRKIVKLINGPIFNTELVGNSNDAIGYYEGLTFNYTKPHIEIITSERPPHKMIQLESEISAEALGLHKKLIRNKAQAMNVMQQTILKSAYRGDKHRIHHPLLQQWLAIWNKSYDPGFLIGVSDKEINLALGYNYTKDISSQPVLKGSIVLKPISKTLASPRISIILQDMPIRTGKWMVIGRVTKGLDIADKISLLPLNTPRHIKTRVYKPKKPIVIQSIK